MTGELYSRQLEYITQFCPSVNTRGNIHKYVAGKFKYTDTTPAYAGDSTGDDSLDPKSADMKKISDLKRGRQTLLSKAHCSLATSTSAQNAEVTKKIHRNWDKLEGTYKFISCDIHNSYQIHNSENQERFEAAQAKTGDHNIEQKFHGTNFSGAAGIIGVDGRYSWNIANAKKAGAMLGPGIYLADKVGKSAGYLGTWGAGYNTRGAILINDCIKGRTYKAIDYRDGKSHNIPSQYDTIEATGGAFRMSYGTLRANEWCCNKADFVSPQVIVDMTVKDRR